MLLITLNLANFVPGMYASQHFLRPIYRINKISFANGNNCDINLPTKFKLAVI
jgi:hypothetical protein